MVKIAPYAKAILGALVAFLTALTTALEDGHVSAQEWVTALIALLAAGGVVFSVPNRRPFISEEDVATLQEEPPAAAG